MNVKKEEGKVSITIDGDTYSVDNFTFFCCLFIIMAGVGLLALCILWLASEEEK